MPNVSALRVPAYRRHKASGQAVVRLADRDIYLGKHGSVASRDAFKRFIAEYVERGGTVDGENPRDTTVLEVMAAYVRFARIHYRKNGQPTSEFRLICEACRFVKPYGQARAVEFGPLALKAVRQTMIDTGHCRNHVNKNISRIKRMFKWAAEEELIPGGVAQSLWAVAGLRKGRTAARESAPVQPVDDAIVEATLPHLPEVVADMVRFQRLTGCRPAEVCGLRPRDLDRSGDVWRYQPESHKTEHHGRARLIFNQPRVRAPIDKLPRRVAPHRDNDFASSTHQKPSSRSHEVTEASQNEFAELPTVTTTPPESTLTEWGPSDKPSSSPNAGRGAGDGPNENVAASGLNAAANGETSPAVEPRQFQLLADLSKRVQSGDQSAIGEIHQVLDSNNELWCHLGDVEKTTEDMLIDVAAGSAAVKESVRRSVAELKQSLLCENPTPLERMAVGRVVACWLFAHFVDRWCGFGIKQGGRAGDFARLLEACEKRYGTALKSLRLVQRINCQ